MRPIRLAAAVAAAGTLIACSSTTTPAPQQSPTSEPTGHGTLAHCLGEHGVPAAPGPAVAPPPGVNPNTWHQAMQACSSLAPGPAG